MSKKEIDITGLVYFLSSIFTFCIYATIAYFVLKLIF